MSFKVYPGKLTGRIAAPPSKSHTHRAFIMGMLADNSVEIKNPLISAHTMSTINALEAFGTTIDQDNECYTVSADELQTPKNTIDVGNSGTSLRLLCGVASLIEGTTTFTGDNSVMKRPIDPLLKALNQLGASCKFVQNNGRLPVIIKGVIDEEYTTLPGDISSQFLSSLLISCPLKNSDTTIDLTTELVSPWYVGLTIDMMDRFDVKIKNLGNHSNNGLRYFTKGIQKYRSVKYEIPGDYASAAFLLVGAAITNSEIEIQNLDPNSSQGDRAILEILAKAGIDIDIKSDSHSVNVRGGELNGVEVDCSNIPDLFPVLAVLGAYAKGRTRLFRAGHVRFKESNRILTTANMLRALGTDIKVSDDEIVINGGRPVEKGVIDPMGDHRIFMAGVIAAMGAKEPITIMGDNCYRNSYPNFINDVTELGGRVEEKP